MSLSHTHTNTHTVSYAYTPYTHLYNNKSIEIFFALIPQCVRVAVSFLIKLNFCRKKSNKAKKNKNKKNLGKDSKFTITPLDTKLAGDSALKLRLTSFSS